MINIAHAKSLSDVYAYLDGEQRLVSRVPLSTLYCKLKWLKVGIFDFDGTLISGSQWREMTSLMPDELKEVEIGNFQWYSRHMNDLEVNSSTLDDPDWWIERLDAENKPAVEGAWVTSALYLLRAAGITREQIKRCAETLKPREGAIELMQLMNSRAVISFGVEQFIKSWLDHVGIEAAVAATRVLFDELGAIKSSHINVMVTMSKELAAKRFLNLTHTREDQLLVVGDTALDASMMLQKSFNVLIMPHGEVEHRNTDFRTNLDSVLDRVSAILVCDSLMPLVDLINAARR